MVKIKNFKKDRMYDYPDDCMETVKINKQIRDDISKFCKSLKINKSKLIENFYKTILLRHREGNLNLTNNYVTIHVGS